MCIKGWSKIHKVCKVGAFCAFGPRENQAIATAFFSSLLFYKQTKREKEKKVRTLEEALDEKLAKSAYKVVQNSRNLIICFHTPLYLPRLKFLHDSFDFIGCKRRNCNWETKSLAEWGIFVYLSACFNTYASHELGPAPNSLGSGTNSQRELPRKR